MNEILQVIFRMLKNYSDAVYYEDAPNKAEYPYLVYNLEDGYRSYREEYILTLDFWDRNQSSSNIENLVDAYDKHLENKLIVTELFSIRLNRLQRLKIEDEDKGLKRRQLKFEVQIYQRKDNQK